MKKFFLNFKISREKPVSIIFIIIIIGLQVIFAYLISITDQYDSVFTHLMYLPIVLAGFIFDFRTGVMSSIIAELLIDLFMSPKINLMFINQLHISILRALCFILAGLTAGLCKNYLEEVRSMNISSPMKSEFGNLPKWDSLLMDIDNIIKSKQVINFRLLLIEVSNQNDLLATFGFDCVNKINNEIIDIIKNKYKNGRIFLLRMNTIGLVLFDIHQDITGLINILEEPVLMNGIPIYCEITIGEASYPESGYTSDDLLKNSFLALNEARKHQKAYHLFNPQLFNPEIPVLLGQFQNAIRSKEIDFYYQPIVQKDDKVSGFEALVRWNHPVKGMVPPNDFIPDLEFTRLTNYLTYYSLDINLARTIKLFNEESDLEISLNISITNLYQPDFYERVRAEIEKHQFPPDHIALEITERGFLSDDPECQKNLNALYKYGVRIAIDDFGVGFTSISNFRNKGIHTIKIDRSFIHEININKGNQAILEGLVSIAKSSGVCVIAEGIESEAEKEKVLELGVDCLQGYFIAKPMNFNTTLQWLRNNYTK